MDLDGGVSKRNDGIIFDVYEKKQNTVIFVRGISGSGKSTTAKKLKSGFKNLNVTVTQLEADHWFIKNGLYKFDKNKLGYVHGKCKEAFEEAINNKKNVVILSNTFVRIEEMEEYIKYAFDKNYNIIFTDSGTTWKNDIYECHEMCVHNVPFRTVSNQYNNYLDNKKLKSYLMKSYKKNRNMFTFY